MTSPAVPPPASVARRVAQGVVSLVVGALSLWFAFRGLGSVDGRSDGGSAVDELVRLLSSFPLWAIGAYVLSFLTQVLLRTERWRLQVRGLTGVVPTWRDALAINAIAFAAVFLLPFRLGEFVRPNLCAQRGIMSASAGLAATALERIIDGLVTTALFGVLLLLAPAHLPAEVRAGGLTALFVFGGAVVFLVVAFRMRAPTLALVERAAGLVSNGLARKLTHLVGGFLDGLACFRGARDVAQYVGLSTLYWLVNALSIHAVVVALVPGTSLFAAFLCMSFLVIGVMLPAPPGNVGNFHAFARVGLTAAGVAALPAVAVAVITHVLTVLCVVVWATLFLAVGGLRVRGAHLADASAPGG
jgi:uncharacterized membrane protein YbhN (UPF0104 family)